MGLDALTHLAVKGEKKDELLSLARPTYCESGTGKAAKGGVYGENSTHVCDCGALSDRGLT